MDPNFELHHGHDDPGTDSPGGLNIHDPVLDSTPELRSLKKQLPLAGLAFAFGMMGGLGLAIWGHASAGVAPVVGGALLAVAGTCYFAYVTIALNVHAQRAKRQATKRRLEAAAAANPHAAKALEAMLEHLSK